MMHDAMSFKANRELPFPSSHSTAAAAAASSSSSELNSQAMMNRNVPHWNLPTPMKPNWLEESDQLVEPLRQDGHSMTAQGHSHQPVEEHHQQCEQSLAGSADFVGDDGTGPFFLYPLGDPLLEDFAAEFFSEMAGINVMRSVVVGTPSSASHQSTLHHLNEKTKPPPPFSQLKFSNSPMSSFGSIGAKMREKGSGGGSTAGGCCTVTIGSSVCKSNQTHVAGGRKDDPGVCLMPSERKRKSSDEATSDSSLGVQAKITQNQKRKRRDMHESEAEYEPTEGKKPAQRSSSTHRSRAAEVHNLSERRRRDRINEKMKALQELIPHCNKADKASMLEEAIEYLKSLQLQVQMMWTGRGMAQVMFPGVQPFMSGTSPLMHNAVNIPSFVGSSSSTSQTQLCPSRAINALDIQSQRPSFHVQGSFAPYLGFHHHQPPFQAMNPSTPLLNSLQQNQPTAAPSSSILPCNARAPCENISGRSAN